MPKWRNWQTPKCNFVDFGASAHVFAQVAELADAIGLGPITRKGVGVQVSPWAQQQEACPTQTPS